MVLHPKTEPLRKLLKQLDDAPLFAKAPYVRELVDRTLMLLAELLHELDHVEKRLAILEDFPELRIEEPSDRVD